MKTRNETIIFNTVYKTGLDESISSVNPTGLRLDKEITRCVKED